MNTNDDLLMNGVIKILVRLLYAEWSAVLVSKTLLCQISSWIF